MGKTTLNLTPQGQSFMVALLKIKNRIGNHLLTLINNILDISKMEARQLELYSENIHFSSFIDGITGIVRMRAEQIEAEQIEIVG